MKEATNDAIHARLTIASKHRAPRSEIKNLRKSPSFLRNWRGVGGAFSVAFYNLMKKQRIQVTAPGEAPVIYAKGQEPQNKTRLREAERRLKRRQFDGCIDTKDCTNHPLVRRRGDNVFEIGETGCLFVPGALSVEEQMQVIVEVRS
jgi:hypothetical protein